MSNDLNARTVQARSSVPGRAPAEPVIVSWAGKPSSCYLCTWQPAGSLHPGKARLKLVHAGCLEHRDLVTVLA